jgi:type II secretion system protein N
VHISARDKKIAKWVGYPLLALFTFIFTLAYTFPYDRLKDKIVEALNDKYDVSIASIEPTLIPGTFTINMMTLRTRPKTPEEKPITVVIKEVEINVGITSAILWSMDLAKVGVEVEAQMGTGSLEMAIEHDKGDNTLFVEATVNMLPIGSMPGVAEAVGLPMTGSLNADLTMSLPKGKWDEADGEIVFSCVGCTVGDGVAKMSLKPRPGAPQRRRKALFQGEGLTVPKLQLGAVKGEIEVKDGKGTIKTMSAKSKDGFLTIEGDLVFKDPFKDSLFPGCMTFGFSEELKSREPKFMGIEAGLPPQAKQTDGSYSLPTKGKLVELRFDVRKQCGANSVSKPRDTAPRSRPRITTTDKDKDVDKVEPRKMPEIDTAAMADKKIDAGVIESGPKLSVKEVDPPAKPDDDEDEPVEATGDGDDDGDDDGPETPEGEGEGDTNDEEGAPAEEPIE